MPQEATLVGRGEQLERLKRRLADAREGHARTVLIGGEAGVGKSRLLSAFTEMAHVEGAHVLSGACEEYFGDPMPYGSLLEALEGFGRDHGEDRAAALGGPAYARLTAFFDLGRDSMGSPQQVFLAVRGMLDHIGADAPVVLILEDLHWADPSTLDLVRYLGQTRPEERRLLLVCSYRSNELDRGDALWQVLASSAFLRRTERFELPPFTLPELREFLTTAVGGKVDPELVRRCFEWSDGIPFYAEQLMVAGALRDPENVHLPEDMKSVVLARLGGLEKNALKVLRVAAVAGRAMSRRLLRTVSGLHGEVLHEALQECFDRQMLVAGQEEDVYRFRHALLREAVYQTTVRDTQIDLHVAMAEALAADSRLCLAEGSAAAEQANHWYQAGVKPQALASAVLAGQTAVRTLAFSSAGVQFARALHLWRQVEGAEDLAGVSKIRLVASAADAARWSGRVDTAVRYIRQAIEETDHETDPGCLGELHERLGNYLWEAGQRAESGAAYLRAAELLDGSPPSAVKARVLAGLALAYLQTGRYANGGKMAAAALEMARTVGAQAEEGRALNISGLALGMQGDHRAGEERLRSALDIARSINHLEDLFRAYGNLGLILEQAGRLREAADVTLEGLGEVRRLDLANTRQGTVLANNASAALVLLGEWDEAEKIITEVSLDRPPAENLYPRLTLAEVKVARGAFGQAHELLASIHNIEHGEDPRFLGPLHAIQAELALWEGDLTKAADEVTRGVVAVRDGENTLELLRLCALGMRCAADRAGAPGAGEADRAAAVALGDELARLAQGVRQAPSTAEADQLVALCKAERQRIRGADTATVWDDVAAGWAAIDRPYRAAYARWREAAAAYMSDDGRRARRAARDAYEVVTVLGAEPLRDRVAQLAARLKLNLAGRRRVPPQRPYGLTETEFTVLRHRFDGDDATQIAATRNVSRRTVETQLGKAYAKLGVHSAVEAIALARRERLFD